MIVLGILVAIYLTTKCYKLYKWYKTTYDIAEDEIGLSQKEIMMLRREKEKKKHEHEKRERNRKVSETERIENEKKEKLKLEEELKELQNQKAGGRVVPDFRTWNDLFDKRDKMPLQRVVKLKPKNKRKKASIFDVFVTSVSPRQANELESEDEGRDVVNDMMSSGYNKYAQYDPYAVARPKTSEGVDTDDDVELNIRTRKKSGKQKLKPLEFTPKVLRIKSKQDDGEEDNGDGNDDEDDEEYDQIVKAGREKLAKIMQKKKNKKLNRKQKKKERSEFIKERKMSFVSEDGNEGDDDDGDGDDSGEEIPSTDDDDHLAEIIKKKKISLKKALKKQKKQQKKKYAGKMLDDVFVLDDSGSEDRSEVPSTDDDNPDIQGKRKKKEKGKKVVTVKAQRLHTAPVTMASATIIDLGAKFSKLGMSDNDGDNEFEDFDGRARPSTQGWHTETVNWGHTSELGNSLYGNSFDDNNRPSVSRANAWASMEMEINLGSSIDIGEAGMSTSILDNNLAFPSITPSLQSEINRARTAGAQGMIARSGGGGRVMTASAASLPMGRGKRDNKNRPLTSASVSDLQVGADGVSRPSTASQFPSWHYQD